MTKTGLRLLGFLVLLLSASSTGTIFAQDSEFVLEPFASDARFTEGLRERGMFETAEFFSGDRLAKLRSMKTAGSPDWNSKVVFNAIELIRTLTGKALASPAKERSNIIREIDAVEEEWSPILVGTIENLQLRFQTAVALTEIGEFNRREAMISSSVKTGIESAIEKFRTVLESCEKIDTEIELKLRESASNTVEERFLRSFRKHVSFRAGIAYKNLSQCYPEASPEHFDMLHKALKIFREISETGSDASIVWESRLETIIDRRLLGEIRIAVSYFEELKKKGIPERHRPDFELERVRLELAQGNTERALGLVESEKFLAFGTPRHELLRLETYLERYRDLSASGSRLASGFHAQGINLAREIDRKHGPYWGRIAQIELAESLRTAENIDTENMETKLSAFLMLAEDAFRKGRYDEAIRNYDSAEQAIKGTDPKRAIDISLTAAAIFDKRAKEEKNAELSLRYTEEAMKRFTAAGTSYPNEPNAPESFLLSIELAGKLLEAGKFTLKEYSELSSDYFDHWPDSPKAAILALQTANLLLKNGRFSDSIPFFEYVPNSGEPGHEAIVGALIAWKEIIASENTEPDEPGKDGEIREYTRTNQAASWFEKRLPQNDTPWNDVDFDTVLAAAELHIKAAGIVQKSQAFPGLGVRSRLNASDSFKAAAKLLDRSMDFFPNTDPGQKLSRDTLRVFALAGLGEREAALAILRDENSGSFETEDIPMLIEMLDDLTFFARGTSKPAKAELAGIRLEITDAIEKRPKKLSKKQERTLKRIKAESLADAGRMPESVAIFNSLDREFPDDLSVLEPFARMLSERTESGAIEASLRLWRKVDKLALPESETWWNAKESIVRAHLKKGEKSEAKKLLEYIRITRPGADGPIRKARFEELRKACEND